MEYAEDENSRGEPWAHSSKWGRRTMMDEIIVPESEEKKSFFKMYRSYLMSVEQGNYRQGVSREKKSHFLNKNSDII